MSLKRVVVRLEPQVYKKLAITMLERNVASFQDLLTRLLEDWVTEPLAEQCFTETLSEERDTYDGLPLLPEKQAVVENTVFSYLDAEEATATLAEKIAAILRDTLLTVPGEILIEQKAEKSVRVSLSEGGIRGKAGTSRAAGGHTPALWHELLDRIFASGHRRAIHAITHNLIAFGEMVQLITRGHPDDSNPSSPETHPREKPAEKGRRKIA